MGSGLPLLERLERDVVLGAEGYLFELEVVLDYSDAVRELHREFLCAGAEVMVAFTYYGHREKLRMIGREDDLEPLNRNALQLAKEVAAEGDALVAGNICNTWAYDPDDPSGSGDVVREMYREQVRWAVEAGADFIVAETNDYLGEALIGVEVIREHGLPAVVTFASTSETTMDGYELDEACKRVENAGADVVGLNCSRGPATMFPILERVWGTSWRGRVSSSARSLPDDAGGADLRLAARRGRLTRFPGRSRPVPPHPLRDGRLRGRRPRPGSELHRHLLRRGPSPRSLDGRGARAHRSRQPLLPRDGAPSGAGRERQGARPALYGLAGLSFPDRISSRTGSRSAGKGSPSPMKGIRSRTSSRARPLPAPSLSGVRRSIA